MHHAPTLPSPPATLYLRPSLVSLPHDGCAPFPPPPSVSNSSETFGGAQRVNIELQKLGARGVSILFASGDIGVNRIAGDGDNCTTFSASFPGEIPSPSPWCGRHDQRGTFKFALFCVVGAP
jgi:hypothetical protein